jgi:hypothetical protein
MKEGMTKLEGLSRSDEVDICTLIALGGFHAVTRENIEQIRRVNRVERSQNDCGGRKVGLVNQTQINNK